MKLVRTLVLVLSVVLLMPQFVLGAPAGSLYSGYLYFTASDSDYVNTDLEPFIGTRSVYLWWDDSLRFRDVLTFEFDLGGDFEIVELIPRPGIVNTGTASSPILKYEGGVCRVEELLVLAEIVLRDDSGSGGMLCLLASENDRVCVQHCSNELWYSVLWWGITTGNRNGVCTEGNFELVDCLPTPVATVSWGSIKALYGSSSDKPGHPTPD